MGSIHNIINEHDVGACNYVLFSFVVLKIYQLIIFLYKVELIDIL